MKRLPFADWVSRHQAAMVVLVIAAGLAVTFYVKRGKTDSQAQYMRAVTAHESAKALLETGQLAESDRHCRLAKQILSELAASSNDRRIRFEEASTFETLAKIQVAAVHPDEADAFYRRAIYLWSRLLGDDPKAAPVRAHLVHCLSRKAAIASDRGRLEEAEYLLERASSACRTQFPDAPYDPCVDREFVSILNQSGSLVQHAGRSQLALTRFETAVQTAKKLVESPAPSSLDRELLISSLCNQARASPATIDRGARLRLYREARKVAEKLNTLSGSSARHRDLLASLLETEAFELRGESGRDDLARGLLERAIALRDALTKGTPVEPEYLDRLAQTCGALADFFSDAHLYANAEEYDRRALSCRSRLANEHPEIARFRFGRGQGMHNLALLLRQRGRAAEALSLEREAAPLLEGVYRENVLDEEHRRAASDAYWALCTLELDRSDFRSAAKAAASYQAIEPNGFEEAHEAAGFLCRCIVLCRNDQGLPAEERDRLVRSYADRAIDALDGAAHEGFRDLDELKKSSVYDPLRHMEKFARIVERVAAIDLAGKDVQ